MCNKVALKFTKEFNNGIISVVCTSTKNIYICRYIAESGNADLSKVTNVGKAGSTVGKVGIAVDN